MDDIDDTIHMQKTIRMKNSFLVPLYSRIRGLVMYLNQDEERKLLDEYEAARAIVQRNFDSQEVEEKLDNLERLYEGLILGLRRELKKPGNLINHLYERYLLFYNLLRLWKEYTHIVRMGHNEIAAKINVQLDQPHTNEEDDISLKRDFYTSEDRGESESDEEDDFDITKIR